MARYADADVPDTVTRDDRGGSISDPDYCEGSAITMTRYERDQFFESLCRLRDVYSHRDEDDRVGTMSIKEVVGWAVREMLALGPVEATAPAQANERKV